MASGKVEIGYSRRSPRSLQGGIEFTGVSQIMRLNLVSPVFSIKYVGFILCLEFATASIHLDIFLGIRY